MKSATSTLQEQLVEQPGIFMTTPKEPNFFSDDDQFAKGMDWYSALYSEASPKDLLGEASTHYTKLPTHPDTVQRLKTYVPEARFVYVMRHPIDRLVSHYIHEWTMGVYSCDIEEAVSRYPELVAYGGYAQQLKPYFEAFGKDRVLPVFFDRLISEPQVELERVCSFIGYQGKPVWHSDLRPSNVSSQRIRRFPLYGALVDSAAATWLRRTLVPQSLRDLVKGRLTMKKRPQLSNSTEARLIEIFDEDLAELGQWLGQPLNCSNFRQVTASQLLNWVQPGE